MKEISVGIADDHSLFREGMRMIISAMPGIVLRLEVASGEELLDQIKTTPIDVLLLDIEMKQMNGIDTLKQLIAMPPCPKVIILSMHTEPRMVSYLMEIGANGYLQKDVKKEELEMAIRTVYEKGSYLNEHIAQSLLAGLRTRNKKPATLTIDLSPREKEVLTLICQEYTTQEIGERLFISDRTVEGHRKNLCMKLEVKNTAGLVKKALLLNLVDHTLL
jgi:DNA-binding NarL/FixJ family response regulator